jgi:hypothetical protein
MACRSTCAQCQSRSALSRSAAARTCLRCLKECCCVIQRVDGRLQCWPVLFFQKPVDCRRHQVHPGRVDCHKPAPAQKDVYTYYLCGKRAGVAVLHVKEQRVKVYGYLGPHLRLFGLLLALAYSSSALLSRWNACWTPQSSLEASRVYWVYLDIVALPDAVLGASLPNFPFVV